MSDKGGFLLGNQQQPKAGPLHNSKSIKSEKNMKNKIHIYHLQYVHVFNVQLRKLDIYSPANILCSELPCLHTVCISLDTYR